MENQLSGICYWSDVIGGKDCTKIQVVGRLARGIRQVPVTSISELGIVLHMEPEVICVRRSAPAKGFGQPGEISMILTRRGRQAATFIVGQAAWLTHANSALEN